MSELARNMLIERRKRLVGSLLDYMERNVYQHLPAGARTDLRKKVIADVGSYHDVCLDLIKATVNDGSVINEQAVAAIEELNRNLGKANSHGR